MASFNFIRLVPSQGTTFVFGSWVCITDGAGNFRRFLVDMRLKTFAADPRSGIDKFVDELDNLPLHTSAAQIEMESAPVSTSSGVVTTSPGLDLFQSRDPHSRSQLGSCEPATDPQEANVSGSLSMLEKDLDLLLQDGKPEATACRGALGCSGPGDLVITSLPKGRIVHWRGMMLSDLLEAEGRLVAHLEPLPFQEGRPLATAAEGSTELVDESSHDLSSRQVLMAEEGEDDGDLPIVNFEAISKDEITANAGDENDADREAPGDMPGAPIEHALNVHPKATPKKQRLRRFAHDKHEAIKREIAKLLAAGFIKEVIHPEWVANPVLVKKKNNEWRMCVDYTDLNKHCPKDHFGLPRIDQVVDSTAGCVLLCFLDPYLHICGIWI
jgi:hypothetical protein